MSQARTHGYVEMPSWLNFQYFIFLFRPGSLRLTHRGRQLDNLGKAGDNVLSEQKQNCEDEAQWKLNSCEEKTPDEGG